MRPLAIAALAAVAVVLALRQLASSAAYGDLAASPSLPAALHAANPRLLRPFLGGALAQAAAAVHEGDRARALRFLAAAGDDARSADLRGRLAQAAGDDPQALRWYVRARDLVRAQGLIDAVAARDPRRARDDERAILAALVRDPAAAEDTGQAWWRLGQLEAQLGDGSAAQRAYLRALALAPNEETYLLAAGGQALQNGDPRAAERYYAAAARVVPDGADARAGLARARAALRARLDKPGTGS